MAKDGSLADIASGVLQLKTGDMLFSEGDRGDTAYLIEEGELEVFKKTGSKEVRLAIRRTGELIGEMSLLDEAPRSASVRARKPSQVLVIAQESLEHLLRTNANAARSLFNTILARNRATGAMLRQSEKMAQLGTLTAGVAHELNNPAAAVKRGSSKLADALVALEKASTQLLPAQRAALEPLGVIAKERATRPSELDALVRADKEEELEDWLDSHDVDEPWELASSLVDLDLSTESLDEIANAGVGDLGDAVRWLGATHEVQSLLTEISLGAGQISRIVDALKQYSFLDQAPVQDVDVHEGLNNTLLILRHKLKRGISVQREYCEDLPKIRARGSELNQVWTNIIDNAADALDGSGTIKLRTTCGAHWITVEIEDDGPGIPPGVCDRVFEAFFTTKPPGKGSGQGLDISWRIVVDNHHGSIGVYSRPGCTCFKVKLPVDYENVDVETAFEVDEELEKALIDRTKTIAVVGISSKPERPGHTVPAYLQAQGYTIIPVNPRIDEVLGQKAYPDLKSIPDKPDMVLVFRRSEEAPNIVEDAIAVGAKSVWMQLGVWNAAAGESARRAGLSVVMDRCMRAVHQRLKREEEGR